MVNPFKRWFGGNDGPAPPAVPPDGADDGGGAAPPPQGPGGGTPANQPLENITRGLQHAAAAANQAVAHQYMRLMDQFFDSQEDGTLVAKTVQMQLDAEHRIEVPLIALTTPRGMALEKMKIFLTLRGDAAQAVRGGHALDNLAHDQSAFRVSLAPHSSTGSGKRSANHLDIEIEFVAQDPPEAIMRLIDEYTNRMLPHKPAAATEEGAST